MEQLIRTPISWVQDWWTAVSQTLMPTPLARKMAGFSVGTFVASMVALYGAFAFQFDSPVWAWVTTWIVAQPTPGMTLSKGVWRFIGTIIGSIMAIVLIALFAQMPELFVFALALLVGGCTVITCLLTNYRSYAAALTAYTAAIIASDSISSPGDVFFTAMSRMSSILLGAACAMAVNMIFAPHRSAANARDKLRAALKDAAERAVFPLSGPIEARFKIGRKLISELIELDTVIEYASAESANFRIQANHARGLVAHLFSLISARRALDAHLARCGWPPHDALDIFHGVIIDFLHEMPGKIDRNEIDDLIAGLDDVHDQLNRLQPEDESDTRDDVVSARFVIDRLEDLLLNLRGALDEWSGILSGRYREEPALPLNFHRDVRAAWINGLRAFLAVAATGAFWIGSAWSSGPNALVFVAVMLSIFSTYPRPDKIGWTFFYTSIPAVVIGILCKYLFVSESVGFDGLTVTMIPFLIPMGLVMAYPPTALMGIAYAFSFIALVAPTNPQQYDLASSINSGVATLVGILFGTLAYILIFPPDPRAARQYVTYRIRRGLELVSLMKPLPPTNSHWETRMYDRIMRLVDPQNPSGTPTDEWLDAGLGALTLGNGILRLRRRLANEEMAADVRLSGERMIEAFNEFLPEPKRVTGILTSEIRRLEQIDPGQGAPLRRVWARVLGNAREMEEYLVAHPRLTTLKPIR